MKTTWLTSAALICLLTSCAGGPSMTVPDDLLSGLPPGKMAPVNQARGERDAALDAANQAKTAITRAEQEKTLAKTELDVAKSELEAARAKADIAKGGSADDVKMAENAVAQAEAKKAVKQYLVLWRTRQVEKVEAEADLADVNLQYAEAKLEAEKARAVQDIDKAKAQEISVSKFELQVAEYKQKQAEAEADLAGVSVEVEEAQKNYDKAVSRLEAITGRPAEAPAAAPAPAY